MNDLQNDIIRNQQIDETNLDLRQLKFKKDTTTHHIQAGGATTEDLIKEFEQVLNPQTILTAELPAAVKKFTNEIQTNFDRTANRLEDIALKMDKRAAQLRARAKDLREAGPDVASIAERWIQYERDSAEHAKYYEPIFNV